MVTSPSPRKTVRRNTVLFEARRYRGPIGGLSDPGKMRQKWGQRAPRPRGQRAHPWSTVSLSTEIESSSMEDSELVHGGGKLVYL